ncbi:MAG: C_GCAxxG_C_C family protein [Desulfobacteraceae bacterium]|nr:MAG: C_GCAxxG_C_C family protein [Desulfobacteraceae bacterium]
MDKPETEKIKKQIAELAYLYEQKYGGCSQAVVGAFKKVLNGIGDDVFKAATGLAGGGGLTGNTCGALSGGIMVLSTFLGREYENFADPEGKRFDSFRLAKELVERFEAEYGSGKCELIQTRILGRFYDIWTERDAFLAAGGHDDKCPSVCADACRWVVEILSEHRLL